MYNLFTSFFRRLQGERRGMGSELKPPSPEREALLIDRLPEILLLPTILIQTLVKLPDVSFWQGVINFAAMKAAGVYGVIIRAGQNAWEDVKFKINWALAKAAGLPRGSYWFYDSRKSPEEQAALWWSLVKGDTGELVHVADFEENYGGPYGKKEHFRRFLEKFQSLSGLPNDRIVIYTGFHYWVDRVGNDPWFKRFQLWLASYTDMASARIPPPWTAADLLFWQYTSHGNGAAYGVSSLNIDLNWYCCTPTDYLNRFPLANLELPPTPPPGGPVTEDKFFKVTTAALNVRSSAQNLGATNDVGDLLINDIVHTLEVVTPGDGITWHRIDSSKGYWRGGAWNRFPTPSPTGQYWSAEKGSNVWMVVTTDPTPVPPMPAEEIVITQTVVSDGYTASTVVNGNVITTTLKPK